MLLLATLTSVNGLKRHKSLEPLMGAIDPPCPFFAVIVLIDSNHLKKHEIDDGTAAAIRRIERARRIDAANAAIGRGLWGNK